MSYGIVGMRDVMRFDRVARFKQSRGMLPQLLGGSRSLDMTKMQVVVTLGVMHLLDASNSDSYYRQVIVSSDPHAHEMFYIDNGHIKQNSTKKGVGVKIHGVYDVTDKTLESAIALVVANKYPQLQSDLIKRDMPIGKLDGEPMGDRELLAKFGFTA